MKHAKNSLNGAAITLCMTPNELERRLNSIDEIERLKSQLDEAIKSVQDLRRRNEMLQNNLTHFINNHVNKQNG